MVQLTCMDCDTTKTVKPSSLKNGIVDYRCRDCSNKYYKPTKQDTATLQKIKFLAFLYEKRKHEVIK